MMAVEAVKEKFYCFLGIVNPTYYQSRGWGPWLGVSPLPPFADRSRISTKIAIFHLKNTVLGQFLQRIWVYGLGGYSPLPGYGILSKKQLYGLGGYPPPPAPPSTDGFCKKVFGTFPYVWVKLSCLLFDCIKNMTFSNEKRHGRPPPPPRIATKNMSLGEKNYWSLSWIPLRDQILLVDFFTSQTLTVYSSVQPNTNQISPPPLTCSGWTKQKLETK